MNLGRIDYESTAVPEGYRCTTCGKHGCKLWREYNTCADYTELVCCDCAGKSQGKDVSRIDDKGMVPWAHEYTPRQRRQTAGAETIGRRSAKHVPLVMFESRCDQIGWRIPAVPTDEGDTFWGYTSVPEPGVRWWKRLPTRS